MIRQFACRLRGMKNRMQTLIRNQDIIFDHVRVIGKNGEMVGDMPTSEGIRLARSQGLDLILESFDADPPVCRISDNLVQKTESDLNVADGFSFDPTLRPATIRFSVSVDDLEFERKIDILRKHLLEKRRCEVVIFFKDKQRVDEDRIMEVIKKIIKQCQDIAKSPDYGPVALQGKEAKVLLWPCNPDQTEPLRDETISIESHDGEGLVEFEQKGHPRKFRAIRARTDPRLEVRGKPSNESNE